MVTTKYHTSQIVRSAADGMQQLMELGKGLAKKSMIAVDAITEQGDHVTVLRKATNEDKLQMGAVNYKKAKEAASDAVMQLVERASKASTVKDDYDRCDIVVNILSHRNARVTKGLLENLNKVELTGTALQQRHAMSAPYYGERPHLQGMHQTLSAAIHQHNRSTDPIAAHNFLTANARAIVDRYVLKYPSPSDHHPAVAEMISDFLANPLVNPRQGELLPYLQRFVDQLTHVLATEIDKPSLIPQANPRIAPSRPPVDGTPPSNTGSTPEPVIVLAKKHGQPNNPADPVIPPTVHGAHPSSPSRMQNNRPVLNSVHDLQMRPVQRAPEKASVLLPKTRNPPPLPILNPHTIGAQSVDDEIDRILAQIESAGA